jgi:Abortive infection alpha
MDPNELIKAAPEIAKGAGALAAAVPFTAIVKRMLGPAADELGQRFGDRVRLYRYGRSLDMLKKAEKMAADAGFAPKAVPIKLLFPLLEGASLEEDEDLHTMWAALLANAASPENPTKIRPAFIAILKQMAPDEAALLNWMFDQYSTNRTNRITAKEVETAFHDPLVSACLDGLESSQLVRSSRTPEVVNIRAFPSKPFPVTLQSLPDFYSLTDRGYEFVTSCQPPKPKEND